MPTIAVAGGTGHLGLTIVEVLKENPGCRVIVLSRKAADTQDSSVPVFEVKYDDVAAVARLLEDNAVHTVICAINVKGPEGGAAEVNLVEAASQSSTTKRFMASSWSMPVPSDPNLRIPQDALRLATVATLGKTDLEWTSLHVGQIADYLGTPHLRSHMGPYAINVDMAHRAAAIPGSGDDVIAFTYTGDIARFVEAALGLPRWEREMHCYSDRRSLNEVVKLAEEATETKFTVTHDSVEMLEMGEMTKLPAHRDLYRFTGKPALQARFAKFGLYTVRGMFRLPAEGGLDKQFPDIKTMTVADIVGVWKGK